MTARFCTRGCCLYGFWMVVFITAFASPSCATSATEQLSAFLKNSTAMYGHPGVRVKVPELLEFLNQAFNDTSKNHSMPTDYVLGSTQVVSTIQPSAGGNAHPPPASVTYRVPLHVHNTHDWISVPLLPRGTIITGYVLNTATESSTKEQAQDESCVHYLQHPQNSKSGRHELLLKGKCGGELILNVVVSTKSTKLNRRTNKASMQVQLLEQSPSTELRLTLPATASSVPGKARRVWDVSLPSATQSLTVMRSMEVDHNNHTLAVLHSADKLVKLRWTAASEESLSVLEQQDDGDEDVDRVEFHAEQLVKHYVANGMLITETDVSYEVTSGEIYDMVLELPQSKVMDVQGDINTWSSKDDGKKTILKVRRANPSVSAFDLKITTELAVNTTAAEISIVGMKTRNVRREQGQIAVFRAANLDVKTDALTRVTRIDVTEAHPNISSAGGGDGLVGVFKFSGNENGMTLGVSHMPSVPTVTCIIHSSSFTVTPTKGGSLCRWKAEVHNMDKAYLVLDLPHETAEMSNELWSTHIDGAPVKPSSKNKGKIMIPLRARTGVFSGQVRQEVEVVYFIRTQKLAKEPGSHEYSIQMPLADVPSLRSTSTIFMPDDDTFVSHPAESGLRTYCDAHEFAFGERGRQKQRDAFVILEGNNFGPSSTASLNSQQYFRSETLSVQVQQPTTNTKFCRYTPLVLTTEAEPLVLKYTIIDPQSLSAQLKSLLSLIRMDIVVAVGVVGLAAISGLCLGRKLLRNPQQ